MKRFTGISIFLILAFLLLSAGFFPEARAQKNDALPELPAPIRNLVDEGAQIRYLGRDYGMDSWLTIKNGQEQYFYVLPDKEAFLMGVLFDNKGKLVTVDQVQRLRAKGDDLLDTLADDEFTGLDKEKNTDAASLEFKSPSERLYYDIENSNWVSIGQQGAPVVYSFIDPQCPHCHALMEDLRKEYIDKGRIQIRMIPVGFKDETRAQAAFLLATPNPQERWFRHMSGDETALPAKSEISQQGIQRNLAVMQSWKFNATPMIVYRAKDGSVKIVQGRPKDLPGLIADIGARS
jgi:thiol:disulfide interchange protein DsbG